MFVHYSLFFTVKVDAAPNGGPPNTALQLRGLCQRIEQRAKLPTAECFEIMLSQSPLYYFRSWLHCILCVISDCITRSMAPVANFRDIVTSALANEAVAAGISSDGSAISPGVQCVDAAETRALAPGRIMRTNS